MAWAAIGLGSNVGDRTATIHSAVRSLGGAGRLLAVSALYETAPIGGPPQGDFLNAVALIDTELSPRGLLEALLAIESGLGRTRVEKWGPRSIDLDLLVYDRELIDEPGLTVPHPRLLERRFALYPLLTVWPRPELPDGTSLAEAGSAVRDQQLTAVSGGFDLEAGDWRPL